MTLSEIDHTATLYEKNKDNFKWDKDVHEIIRNRLFVDMNTKNKIRLKKKLAIGEMPPLNKLQQKALNIKMYGHARKKDFNLIPHLPFIDQIYEEAIGELERQPFEPSATDIGLFSRGEKNRMHLMALQESLLNKVYEPYRQKITKEYQMKYGIEDLTQLSHEDQQQVQSDINARVAEMTPERINEYFEKEYHSPFSEMAQMLTNYECAHKNLKDHFDNRFKHGYLNGVEISYIYESFGLPRIELCDREKFSWEGAEGVECIEDGECASYDTERSIIDIFHRYGHKLTTADIKKIEKTGHYSRSLNGDFNISGPVNEVEMMRFYDNNKSELFPNGINIRTEKGQEQVLYLRSLFNNGLAHKLIRDCHTVIKTPIQIKCVTRSVNGRIEYSWRSNDYFMNPEHGDIEVKTMRALQVRQCRSLGDGSEKVYLDAGPLGFDWSDISDPREKKLPYSGGLYGRDFNEDGVAPFDKGINFQIKINIEAARLEEEKGFNLGKLFVMLDSARPDGYTPEMFFDTMKGTRVINLDETKLNPQLAGALLQGGRIFNSVDMTNNVAVKDSMEQIEAMYRSMRRVMGVEGREVSPYASIENVRQAQANSSTRTFDMYNKHAKFVNNTLKMYMDFCMYVYSRNPEAINWVANDMNMSVLAMSDFFKLGRIGVFVNNSIESQIEIREFKQETLPFIQTGAYEVIVDFARIRQSKSWGEILNAAEGLSLKSRKMREQAQQAQQAAMEEEYNKQIEAEDRERDHQKGMHTDKLINSLDLAEINASQMRNAADVNKDNQNDLNQRDEIRLRYEKDRDDRDRAFKMQVEKEKNKLKEQELKNDLKKIDAMKKRERLATKVRK